MTWSGTPISLGTWWTVSKGARELRCQMYSHPFGWELRLEGSGGASDIFARTQVCRNDDEVLTTVEGWLRALTDNDWARPA